MNCIMSIYIFSGEVQMARTGKIEVIIGPMFSGKCLSRGTYIPRQCNICADFDIVAIEELSPGDTVFDENYHPVKIATVSMNVSTQSDPLYHVEYLTRLGQKESITATLDHLVCMGEDFKDPLSNTPIVGVKLRDIVENPSPYHAIVSAPIIGRQYYGITLVQGYYFMIISHDENGNSYPFPTHNSSLMVNIIERYCIARKKCIIIKHASDTRDGGALAIRTHAPIGSHDHTLVPVQYASHFICPEVEKAFTEHDVIGIDEIQFFAWFDKDVAKTLSEYLDQWASRGKIIICAGLDSDWRREPFGIIAPLIAHADEVKKLCAVCMKCQADASFSARTLSESAYDNPVGGTEKYVALCRKCYLELPQI